MQMSMTIYLRSTIFEQGKKFKLKHHDCISFFGNNFLQTFQLYVISVKGLALKQVCETRREYRLESVNAVKELLKEISEALTEVCKTTKTSAIQSEANSLLEYEMIYEFILSTVIWYDLLNSINKVSKTLQNEQISIDFALKNYNSLKCFFQNYRNTGYSSAKK